MKTPRAKIITRQEVPAFLSKLGSQIFSASFLRRTALVDKRTKQVLAPVGSVRHLTCKLKDNNQSTADWSDKGGKRTYDPAEYDLFPVYTVEGVKGNDGKGNHFATICLRTVFELRVNGKRIKVK